MGVGYRTPKWFRERIMEEFSREGVVPFRKPRTLEERISTFEGCIEYLRGRVKEEQEAIAALSRIVESDKTALAEARKIGSATQPSNAERADSTHRSEAQK